METVELWELNSSLKKKKTDLLLFDQILFHLTAGCRGDNSLKRIHIPAVDFN